MVSGRIPAGAFVPDAVEACLVDALERAEERANEIRVRVEQLGSAEGSGDAQMLAAADRTLAIARDRLRQHRNDRKIVEGVRRS